MPWVLAIDFGTSSTAAAVAFDGSARPVEIEGSETTMLSNVFLDESTHELLLGAEADNAALTAPWSVHRTPKNRVGLPYMRLGKEDIEVPLVIGRILRHAADAAIAVQSGESPALVRLTHPVRWGQERRDGLVQAAEKAGFERMELMLEPVAAALSYDHADLEAGQHVAVYDLGGGTFDTAILQRTEDGFKVVGTPGGDPRLGGEEFDTRLHRHLARKLPEDQRQRLLAKPKSLEDAPWAQANRQFMRNVRTAKELLSAETETSVTIPAPVAVTLRVTREEFNNLIRGDIEESVRGLHRTIRSAGLEPLDLAAVFLAGGSSNIPLVSQLINERLGMDPILLPQPKEAISLGAALGAHPARRNGGGRVGGAGASGAGSGGAGGGGAGEGGAGGAGGGGAGGTATADQDTDETRLDIAPLDREPDLGLEPPKVERQRKPDPGWEPPKVERQPKPDPGWEPPKVERQPKPDPGWEPPKVEGPGQPEESRHEPEPDTGTAAGRSAVGALLARSPGLIWGLVCTAGAVICVLMDVLMHEPFKNDLGFEVVVAVVIGGVTALQLARGDTMPRRGELLWLRAAFGLLLAGEFFIFTDYPSYGSIVSQFWIASLASIIGAVAGLLALRPVAAAPRVEAAPPTLSAKALWRQPWALTVAGCGVIVVSFFLHGTGPDDDLVSVSAWGQHSKRYAVIATLLCLAVAGLSWRGIRSARERVAAAIIAGALAGIIVPGWLTAWKHLTIGEWLAIIAVSFTVIVTSLSAGLLTVTRRPGGTRPSG